MKKPRIRIPRAELVEVVDAANRPLCVMPLDEVHRQGLYHRSVLVLVHDPLGRLYLQRRSRAKSVYPGRYDLSATGHVKAGEAVADAARRELFEELAVRPERLVERGRVAASRETAFEFVTLFSAGVVHDAIRPDPVELDGGLFVDRDELACLVADFRELLTPGVVYFFEINALFP